MDAILLLEVLRMAKSTIGKTWIAGLVVFGAGVLVSMLGVFLMLAYGGTFAQVAGSPNYEFMLGPNGFFWLTIALIVVGGLVALVGGVIQLAAWLGALVNSYALPEKTWFLVLLIGGVLSLAIAPIGFAAMVAYVAAAPDGATYRASASRMRAGQPGPLAPTA